MTEPLFAVVIDACARHYSVDPGSVLGKGKKLSQIVTRHTAMYVARLVGNFSYPQIAEAFGKKCHTTVMNACARMAQRTTIDPDYDQAVKTLVREVQGLGLTGAPVKIRTELLELLQARVREGVYGRSVEDLVDRILCDHFQRVLGKRR